MGAKVSFSSRENPRIQMADLVAREAMKDLNDQLKSPQKDRRRSIITLFTDGHVKFDVVGKDYCAGWRAWLDSLESVQGINGESLGVWLADNDFKDDLPNRLRYLEWLQSKKPS